MKKSIISLLLALLMTISLPAAAFAADNDDPHIEDTPGTTVTVPNPPPTNP